MSNVEYIEGDVRSQSFESDYRYIPHCCNDIKAMGSGVAYALLNKWPIVRHKYLEMDQELGKVGIAICSNDTVVFNMIAQHGVMSGRDENGTAVGDDGKPPIRYDALEKCMNKISLGLQMTIESGKTCEIHCPKFGSDLAGGDWDVIEKMIIDKWLPFCRVLVCVK